MNFRRQMQAWLAGWQARRVFNQPFWGFGRLARLLCGMSFETPLPLTPHECPALVGGMAGIGEKNRVLIKTRLTFPKPSLDSLPLLRPHRANSLKPKTSWSQKTRCQHYEANHVLPHNAPGHLDYNVSLLGVHFPPGHAGLGARKPLKPAFSFLGGSEKV